MSRNLVRLAVMASVLFGGAALACDGATSCPMKRGKASASSGAKTADGLDVLAPVDELLSSKCDCGGKGDCTCKRGACKCSKCSNRKPAKVVPSMRDADVELPREARHDASGGVFI